MHIDATIRKQEEKKQDRQATTTTKHCPQSMSKKSSPLEGARKPSPTSQDTTSKATTNKVVDNLVTELRPHDVIMGRGLSVSEYEGNKRLRKMVQSRREAYVNAESREAKQNVAREIIAAVRAQGGRFLRRHVAFGASSTQSVWQAIQDPEEMMTKVKQLLRDMAPEVKERRVQRRRRQAEWARQHAYTNLFPDVPNCPFGGSGGSNENNGNSKSVKPPASASATTATTRNEPVLSVVQGVPPSLTASLNSSPHDILPPISSLPAATTTPTSSLPNSLTGIWERAAANHNASRVPLPWSSTVSSLTLQDVQRLLVRQQQEQEQQRLRLLESLSASAQALTTSSALPISSNTTTTIDPRLVLLELQRHAGSAPRMALSESASTAQQRVPAARTLDRAFQDLDRSSSSSSSMNTNTDFRHLSEEYLACLVLLERWNSLRR